LDRQRTVHSGEERQTNARILLANVLQSSSRTFSCVSFPSFFAFKEGMWDTPISARGGWPTVSARLRDTSHEGAISPAYHAQKLSPEINVVLVVGLEVFTQYGVIRH
jgi:hypothetical protein